MGRDAPPVGCVDLRRQSVGRDSLPTLQLVCWLRRLTLPDSGALWNLRTLGPQEFDGVCPDILDSQTSGKTRVTGRRLGGHVRVRRVRGQR